MSKLSNPSMFRFFCLSFLFFAALQVCVGQTLPVPGLSTSYKKPTVRLSMQNGNILKNRTPFFSSIDEAGNPIKATSAFSIEYGWQMLGGKEWHQTCKYPRLGIGTQYLHVMRRDELGNPFSVYGFYDGIYWGTKKFQFTNRMAVGLTYGLNTYNPNDKLSNDVISTKLNGFVELGIGMALRLSDIVFIEPGFRFSHISNGNIRKPQRGINIASYSIGLRSVFGSTPTEPIRIPISECLHRHEVLGFIGMAPRQLEFKDSTNDLTHKTYGMNYLMANLHLGYNYEISHRFKLGGGVDFVYDGTNGAQECMKSDFPQKSDVALQDKIGLSVFIGGEAAIEKLSVVTTLGYMVAQTRFEYSTPAFEQRLGLKYHFYRNVFAGVNIRAYKFRAAKAIEFNIGMRKFLK